MRLTESLEYTYTGSNQEIIRSADAISGIGAVLDRLKAARALVVCGPSILAHSDVVQRVQQAMGDRAAGLFSGVAPHLLVDVLHEATHGKRTGA